MRKKPMPVRKRKALRRIAAAALLLVLINHVFLIGLLFPIQAIRHNEERMGVGWTSVVCRDWSWEIGWNYLAYLTQSEEITMLSGANLGFLGWTNHFGVPLDCSGDAPLYGGWWSVNRGGDRTLLYAFGRIDDPAVSRLRIEVQYVEADETTGTVFRTNHFAWSSQRENWVETNGHTYFLSRKNLSDRGKYSGISEMVAIGYDGEGNEIVRQELETGASAHVG